MPPLDPEQDKLSALAQAQAALSQLTFHLHVQTTAIKHATVLAEQVRQQLLHADPEPPPTDLPICPIDQQPISLGQTRALACGHVFHAECIEHWLKISNTCPLDRSVVTWPAESATEDTALSADSGSTTARDFSLSRPSSISSVSSAASVTIDMTLIETLAFHHRLIAEHELLATRAAALVLEDTETDLNIRWAEFLQTRIAGLHAAAESVEYDILGPDEAGDDDDDDDESQEMPADV
ncbi:hypothetical protein LTR08_007666 [Meristemomyces frigidus]|nr:hypothetical protein LTR08_007666 [Meristemomyces frigidus]